MVPRPGGCGCWSAVVARTSVVAGAEQPPPRRSRTSGGRGRASTPARSQVWASPGSGGLHLAGDERGAGALRRRPIRVGPAARIRPPAERQRADVARGARRQPLDRLRYRGIGRLEDRRLQFFAADDGCRPASWLASSRTGAAASGRQRNGLHRFQDGRWSVSICRLGRRRASSMQCTRTGRTPGVAACRGVSHRSDDADRFERVAAVPVRSLRGRRR